MPCLDRRFRKSRTFVSALCAQALFAAALPPTATATAAVSSPAPRAWIRSAPASPVVVLTLEGPEDLAGPLTGELHDALAKRGLAQPEQGDLPLAEFRMTMGCDGNAPTCLAEGGKTLEAGSLLYGSVQVEGGEATVSLVLLDVATAAVAAEANETVPADEIAASAGSVAEVLVARILGEAPPPPAPDVAASDAAAGPPDAGPATRIVWGRYEPVPAWKWAFLGTSAALLAGSVVTAAVTTAMIAPKGPLRDELLQAAEDSLTDDRAANDIDPNMDGDLCEAARAQPPGGAPGTVTNAAVTKVCNRGDALAKVATATWITTGIFAATTIAATTLLFVHKASDDRRAFRFGASAGRKGAFVAASFRF